MLRCLPFHVFSQGPLSNTIFNKHIDNIQTLKRVQNLFRLFFLAKLPILFLQEQTPIQLISFCETMNLNFFFRILCHCAERTAAKGYTKFGLTYYAECWAGPDHVSHDRHGTSDRCVNENYNTCPIKDDAICCGSDNNYFVYELL